MVQRLLTYSKTSSLPRKSQSAKSKRCAKTTGTICASGSEIRLVQYDIHLDRGELLHRHAERSVLCCAECYWLCQRSRSRPQIQPLHLPSLHSSISCASLCPSFMLCFKLNHSLLTWSYKEQTGHLHLYKLYTPTILHGNWYLGQNHDCGCPIYSICYHCPISREISARPPLYWDPL